MVVACGFGLVFASAAPAATVTIGAPDLSGNDAQLGCFANPTCTATLAQLTQPTQGVFLRVPADGVITAWRIHGHANGGSDGTLALRVLRPAPDGISFTGVATSGAVAAGDTDGSPAHAVSIPVRAGDQIGVDTTANALVFATGASGADTGIWSGGLADGATMAPSGTDQNERLMLNAVESLPAAVSSVSPSSGSTVGGEAVTIRGSDLDGATGVSFGATPAGSFTASPTQITATAPPHAQGTVDVRVTSPGGTSPTTDADLYSYVAPGVSAPSIAIASPADGGTYLRGHLVAVSYSCTAPKGTTVTSCAGPVANGAPIDDSTLGSHRFTVIAQDSDGGSATMTATYTVASVLLNPKLSTASETNRTWREGNALPQVSAKRKPPVGTTFSFGLNEPASVTLSFTHRAPGRKAHHKCVVQTRTNRHAARCTRVILAGHLIINGHPGTNKIRFAGRISHTNKLKPGRYTLTITATGPQHVRSAPRSLNFTIIK